MPERYLRFTSFKDVPAPFGFETRGVNCPDGITRLLTYPRHIWDWNDYFIDHDTFGESQHCDIKTCWRITQTRYPDTIHERFPFTFFLHIVNKYRLFNRG